jgi:hypothetical protein
VRCFCAALRTLQPLEKQDCRGEDPHRPGRRVEVGHGWRIHVGPSFRAWSSDRGRHGLCQWAHRPHMHGHTQDLAHHLLRHTFGHTINPRTQRDRGVDPGTVAPRQAIEQVLERAAQALQLSHRCQALRQRSQALLGTMQILWAQNGRLRRQAAPLRGEVQSAARPRAS